MRWRPFTACVPALVVLTAQPAEAQAPAEVSGHVAVLADVVPRVPGPAGAPDGASELRIRAGLDVRRRATDRLTLRAAVVAEGLTADRTGTTAGAATLQPHDLTVTWSTSRVDLTAGMAQVVWGRLDEFQPTDVVNPLDIARFFLDGRTAARRAVGLARARLFLPRDTTLDAIVVPAFRPGTFDVLGAATSPFSLAPRELCGAGTGCLPVRASVTRPGVRLANAQAGARLTGTAGRLDWGLMGWRGFEALPIYTAAAFDQARPGTIAMTGEHQRTTVVGGDVETVLGAVGLRAEAAWHLEDTLQATDRVAALRGRSLDLGAGLDRRAGDYRVSLTVLATARMPDDGALPAAAIDRRDVQVVAAADRSFARETRRLRLFGVVNPGDQSAFVRGVGSWSLRDGWWLEGSAGWFAGDGADTLSRLAQRDFLSLSLTVHY